MSRLRVHAIGMTAEVEVAPDHTIARPRCGDRHCPCAVLTRRLRWTRTGSLVVMLAGAAGMVAGVLQLAGLF